MTGAQDTLIIKLLRTSMLVMMGGRGVDGEEVAWGGVEGEEVAWRGVDGKVAGRSKDGTIFT